MNVRLNQVTFLVIFGIWMVARLFPIIAVPGLYSIDAWIHLGYTLGIAENYTIPQVDPILYPYYHIPFLHIFSVLLSQFLGINLLASLQLSYCIFVVANFMGFYLLFRILLQKSWATQLALLFLALSPDIIAQMNAPIPEAIGIFYMSIALMLLIKYEGENQRSISVFFILTIIMISVVFTHHLTTLFFILSCIAILAVVILKFSSSRSKNSLLLVSYSLGFSLVLLLSFNPFVIREIQLNFIWVVMGLLLLIGGLIILSVLRTPLLKLLTWGSRVLQSPRSIIFGVILGGVFLFVTVVFYPHSHPMGWRIMKFGLLAALFTLAISIFDHWLKEPIGISRWAIQGFWFCLLAITFIGSTFISFIQNAPTVFFALAPRHFPFLALAVSGFAATALVYWVRSRILISGQKMKLWQLGGVGVSLGILGIFLLGGAINAYYPIGGWHQPWQEQSEMQAGIWLISNREGPSSTITDGRLGVLIQGLVPFVPSVHSIEPLQRSLLDNLSLLNTTHHNYFFISDRLEQAFLSSEQMDEVIMINFVVPPVSFPCREQLDSDVQVVRVYASSTTTIYLKEKS
jgi:hypothetical protein